MRVYKAPRSPDTSRPAAQRLRELIDWAALANACFPHYDLFALACQGAAHREALVGELAKRSDLRGDTRWSGV